MTGADPIHDSPETRLCKSCGLCCNGYLFIWAKLRPSELDPAEALGMQVFRSDPRQRGFNQPCPLWQDAQCAIHDSRHYPHVCRAYKCGLLKELLGGGKTLAEALESIAQAKACFEDVKALLAVGPGENFRERFVARIESGEKSNMHEPDFKSKADVLLAFYEDVFGVKDLFEKLDET